MQNQIDAIIVLGGGRNPDGSLTRLSNDRLDGCANLFHDLVSTNPDIKIIVPGGKKSTFLQTEDHSQMGSSQKKQFLMDLGIREEAIIKAEGGGDTICEAFATRKTCQEQHFNNVFLVTSHYHEPRALWIFQRIFGKEISVRQPNNIYLYEDKLNPLEEQMILELTQKFLQKKFGNDPIPDQNLDTWHDDQHEFYEKPARLHTQFKESNYPSQEAYASSGQKEK
jgi:uncharacterized SAM-binding protein YcdF (DUF218 family)